MSSVCSEVDAALWIPRDPVAEALMAWDRAVAQFRLMVEGPSAVAAIPASEWEAAAARGYRRRAVEWCELAAAAGCGAVVGPLAVGDGA